MKKTLMLAAFAALSATAVQAAPPPAVTPKIVVFDERALMQFSKAGQDIQRQVQVYAKQLQSEKDSTEKSLQAESQQLQQQVAILAPDVRQKRIEAFQKKAAGAQASLQRKAQGVDGGMQQAQRQISNELRPILQQIMKERGANMVVLKQTILLASDNSFDITGDVITRLNAKLPTVKVSMAAAAAAPKP